MRSALATLQLKGYSVSRGNLLVLSYEKHLQSPDTFELFTKNRIAEFLNVPNFHPKHANGIVNTVPHSIRQNPGTLREKIANYDALNLGAWLENKDNYILSLGEE